MRYRRQSDDSWLLLETRDPEAQLELLSVAATLAVAEIYAKVRLDEPFSQA